MRDGICNCLENGCHVVLRQIPASDILRRRDLLILCHEMTRPVNLQIQGTGDIRGIDLIIVLPDVRNHAIPPVCNSLNECFGQPAIRS